MGLSKGSRSVRHWVTSDIVTTGCLDDLVDRASPGSEWALADRERVTLTGTGAILTCGKSV